MEIVESIATDRLSAERLRPSHLADLCRMHQDATVMATLGGVRPDEQTQHFLLRNLDHWERHGYGLWVFRDRSDGRFVGRGGLRRVLVNGCDEVELAYALMAEFWGQGLATEMAQTCVGVAFNRLGLRDLICFTLTTNRASQRVMEKAGFRFEREVVYEGWPTVFYRQTPLAAYSA